MALCFAVCYIRILNVPLLAQVACQNQADDHRRAGFLQSQIPSSIKASTGAILAWPVAYVLWNSREKNIYFGGLVKFSALWEYTSTGHIHSFLDEAFKSWRLVRSSWANFLSFGELLVGSCILSTEIKTHFESRSLLKTMVPVYTGNLYFVTFLSISILFERKSMTQLVIYIL